MPQKTVAVFGGSFSPPTRAHYEITQRCLQLSEMDEVWLLPSAGRTDKRMAASAKDQLAMLRLLVRYEFSGSPRLKIVETELRRGIATETYDTYREFLREYPGTDFWFVYGSDSYATIRTWLRGNWLVRHLPVMIVPRNGIPLPPASSHIRHMTPLSAAAAPISSTFVRQTLQTSGDVSPYVPAVIARYIREHELFTKHI